MPVKRLRQCVACGGSRIVRYIPKKHICRSCSMRAVTGNKTEAHKLAVKIKCDRERYKNNKALYAIQGYRRTDRLRAEMIAAYGGKCLHCGEDDHVVLVLDHIFDDGRVDGVRGNGGVSFYSKLKRAGWPRERLQLLCHNCNFRKEYQRRIARRVSWPGELTLQRH